jgi:hypothetical protein
MPCLGQAPTTAVGHIFYILFLSAWSLSCAVLSEAEV